MRESNKKSPCLNYCRAYFAAEAQSDALQIPNLKAIIARESSPSPLSPSFAKPDYIPAYVPKHILNKYSQPDAKPMERYIRLPFPWRRKLFVQVPEGATREQTTDVARAERLPANNDQNRDEDNIGIKILYDPTDASNEPEVDIVCVHGLSGHRERTWTTQHPETGESVFWVRDFLPRDIPKARIMTFGYDSAVTSARYLTQRTLYSHSQRLLTAVKGTRQGASQRPLIFVAHSLGGIVVKSALIHSDREESGFKDLQLSTVGIMFFGTPHQGNSNSSWAQLVNNVTKLTLDITDTGISHTLDTDLEWLQLQLEQYKTLSANFYTCCFHEGTTSENFTENTFEQYPIVEQSAAVPMEIINFRNLWSSSSLDRSHVNLVKFISRDDFGYHQVHHKLGEMCRHSGDISRENRFKDLLVHDLLTKAFSLEDNFHVPVNIPMITVNHFVGRDSELRVLHEHLTADSNQRVVPLLGLGGIGKTQLALHYANQNKDKFSSIFWVDASSRFSLLSSVAKIAEQLKNHYVPRAHLMDEDSMKMLRYLSLDGLIDANGQIQPSQQTPQLLFEAVKRWLERPGNVHWLLIFDNADDPDTFGINEFLGSPISGHVIVTSRAKHLQGRSMRLDRLGQKDSVELLRYTGKIGMQSSGETAEELQLVEMLHRHPLAIVQAGAFLAQSKLPLDEYMSMFSLEQKHIATQLQDQGEWIPKRDSLLPKGPESSIAITWSISYEAIKTQNNRAADLLHLLTFLDHEISVDNDIINAVIGGDTSTGIKEILSVLDLFSLIHINHDTSTHIITLNSLLRQWLREIKRNNLEYSTQAKFVCSTIASVARKLDVPDWTPRQWILEQATIPHIMSCAGYIDVLKDTSSGEVEWKSLGNVCWRHGRYEDAKKFYAVVLREDETLRSLTPTPMLHDLWRAERNCGPNHLLAMELAYSLASLYQKEGEHAKAEIFLRRTKAARDRTLGSSHRLTLKTSERLGLVLQQQGKYRQAESLYRSIHSIAVKTLGDNHHETLKLLGNIAVLLTLERRFAEAAEVYREVLGGMEKTLGMAHADWVRMREYFDLSQRQQVLQATEADIAHLSSRDTPESDEVQSSSFSL